MTAELKQIWHLFQQKIGLDPNMISAKAWERIIKERMALCEIYDSKIYIQRLHSSSTEFQEFIELLIVPETWFFRDKASLEFIVENVKERLNRPKFHSTRILSLPCSSGEEPYSIAMMFLNECFPSNLLHIDGVDISKIGLNKAEKGKYNKNSFRTNDNELSFRDHYFTKVASNYIINPAVREMVHFSYGNLFDVNFSKARLPYDVIFCRNLFIYLQRDARKKAIEMIKRFLTPPGLFIVSPAEVEIVRSFGFVPYGPSKVCVFQKPKNEVTKSSLTIKTPTAENNKDSELLIKPVIFEKQIERASLEEARHLADLGKLNEALNICRECLKQCNTDPKIYFLIGLIEQASGHEKISAEYFLKTVYLDPDAYEALIYLALIAEKQGEFAQAELFRSRAKRLADK